MLVKNLIKRLEKMNPEAQVRISYKDGEVLLFVMAQVGHDDIVWLESESDCDMKCEIQTRFDDAIENGTDELDVYAEMLEAGIDVDMVRRYMGNQAADHMQEFCESHGLADSIYPFMTESRMHSIISDELQTMKLDKGIYEFHKEGDLSIGVSYETFDTAECPDMSCGYIVNLFDGDEYINITGHFASPLDAVPAITNAWNMVLHEKAKIAAENQQITTEEKEVKRFEKLKSALFNWGSDYIEEFLGFEYDPDWDKDTIDNAMDEVYQQMDEEDLIKFYEKFCIE